jgi:hypothetical protein
MSTQCFSLCRLLLGLEYALLVWWTPKVEHQGGFPLYYYIIVLLSYALHQVSGGKVLSEMSMWALGHKRKGQSRMLAVLLYCSSSCLETGFLSKLEACHFH